MTPKRLLVLDLNGTILHRLTHAFETRLFRNHPVVLEKKLKPDVTVNGCKIVFRPHAITFLSHILKHFDVAVWTSSRAQNALPMVHYSFKNLLDFSSILDEAVTRGLSVRQVVLGPSDKGAEFIKDQLLEVTRDKAKLKFIWTQTECDIDKIEGEAEDTKTDTIIECTTKTEADDSMTETTTTTTTTPTTETKTETEDVKRAYTFIKPIRKKNLAKIYEAFPDLYTPSNTLIIDDTDAKLADHLENHLKIDEFSVTQHEIDFTADRKLLQLKKYLDRLVKEDPQDLRTFLEKYHLEDF